jgi:hypothetical protein
MASARIARPVTPRHKKGFNADARKAHSAAIAATKQERGPDHRSRITSHHDRGRLVVRSEFPLESRHAVWSGSSEDHDGDSASVSCWITQQEVETQIHADRKRFTRIAAELTFTHVQPGGRASGPSACIPSYRRASALPLSWPTRRRGIGEALPTRLAAPHEAVVRGTHRLVGTVPVPRRIIVAALFSQCDPRRSHQANPRIIGP